MIPKAMGDDCFFRMMENLVGGDNRYQDKKDRKESVKTRAAET
jgi:hypothetical protein